MDILSYNSSILSHPRHYIAPLSEESKNPLAFVTREGRGEWFLDEASNCSYFIGDELDTTQSLPNEKKRELIFVIGLNIREIELIYGRMNPNSTLIICEPNLHLFAHALNTKDLGLLCRNNVIVCAAPTVQMMPHLHQVLGSSLLLLLGNIKIYTTSFYRQYALRESKEVIEVISLNACSIRWGAGNSIDDCLEGSTQVMKNLKYLVRSKDVRGFKNRFAGKPVIIVSAGPSLEKNIQLLHKVGNRAIIISTESILERLLKEGITPHFVTTMERVIQAYEFSYKGKVIPPEVTLVAPPVIKPMIYEEYKGDFIIPMRDGVREFYWWNDMLGLGEDANVLVGDSTAHLALGLALHVGANPIVLIGQDLAFGEGGTGCHAGGTIYEEIGTNYAKDPMQEPDRTTEGYYGGTVMTNQLWLGFKKWFELYADKYKGKVRIINATEGGARIQGTEQMPLAEVIEQFCVNEIPVVETVKEADCYSLDYKQICNGLKNGVKQLRSIEKVAQKVEKNLKKIKVTEKATEKELLKMFEMLKETDELWKLIQGNNLLFHNVQPMIIQTFYRLYQIEEVLRWDTIKANIDVQLDWISSILFVIKELIREMNCTINELANEKQGA